MILKIFLFILLAYLLFEFIKHIVIPLFWLITKKKRRPVTGDSGLIGEVDEVKERIKVQIFEEVARTAFNQEH